MEQQKKLIGIIFVLLVLLFFRDVPYLNILVLPRIWIVYLLLIFYLLPFRSITIVYVGAAVSLVLSLFFTLLSFSVGAEIFGVLIYVCFWIIVVYRLYLCYR